MHAMSAQTRPAPWHRQALWMFKCKCSFSVECKAAAEMVVHCFKNLEVKGLHARMGIEIGHLAVVQEVACIHHDWTWPLAEPHGHRPDEPRAA